MAGYEWGETLPTLPGDRLDLRWLTREDAPALLAIFGDDDVMEFWSSPPLANMPAATALVDEIHRLFAARELFQWGICPRQTNRVIGTCTLLNIDLTHQRAELGIALARSAWGCGYATEALELLVGFAFRTLDLHRLEADIDPENERSLRLFESQGFAREGHLRERWHHLGELRDTILLGLLRREWPGPSVT